MQKHAGVIILHRLSTQTLPVSWCTEMDRLSAEVECYWLRRIQSCAGSRIDDLDTSTVID